MKRIICSFLVLLLIINTIHMTVTGSENAPVNKSVEEAKTLMLDKNGQNYYRQFLRFNNPVYVNIAEEYLKNKIQFNLTNEWSNLLNEEYRRTGDFKNEYIFDLIIMGFLKFEAENDTFKESLANKGMNLFTEAYSIAGDELEDAFKNAKKPNAKLKKNVQIIKDLNIAMSIVDYVGDSFESYRDIMASKLAIMSSKREKIALFKASIDCSSQSDYDDGYERVMNSIINAMESSDPTEYLNNKTGTACWNMFLKLTEDGIKEVCPIFALLDLSVVGIDLLFNSSTSASNDIQLTYLYLTRCYLHDGLISLAEIFREDMTSENAKNFIDAFKTYLEFEQYGNMYADKWLDNFIQTRSTPIKRLFNRKRIQEAQELKQQCVSENNKFKKMLQDINALENEDEGVWKIIVEEADDSMDANNNDIDYDVAYYKAFMDAGERHQKVIDERKVSDQNVEDMEGNIPYTGISYQYCDITGDKVKELIFTQVYNKHAAEFWVYGLDDQKKAYLMGTFEGDTVDQIVAGYKQGVLLRSEYKADYGLIYQEWNGNEFQYHELYHGTIDYFNQGNGDPKEAPTFEELKDYYDADRITDYPTEHFDFVLGQDNQTFVTDAYVDAITVGRGDGVELFCYHIPEINLNGITASEVNAQIYGELKGILDDELYTYIQRGDSYPMLAGMHYTWGYTQDVLSIVVQTNLDYAWWDYYVYNISLTSGEKLSDQKLFDLFGVSEDEFRVQVRLELEAYIDSMYTSEQIGEEVYQMIVQQTVSEENISGARPYITSDGRLGYVVNVYSPAGADSYYHLMNYDDGREIDRIDCLANHSESIANNQSDNQLMATTVSLESLTGTWGIDAEYTMDYNGTGMTSIFGTAYKYGNQMNINSDGAIDYYVGVGYGGQGTYELIDNILYAEIALYESNAHETLELMPVSDEADASLLRLKTNIAGYDIFWKKQ